MLTSSLGCTVTPLAAAIEAITSLVFMLELVPDPAAPDRGEPSTFERQIANRFKIADHGRPGDRWLIDTVGLAWRTRILAHIESDLRLRLWQAAEDAAVQVFAGNLRDLLLAAPAGARPSMGLDPGVLSALAPAGGYQSSWGTLLLVLGG